jgi:uncharacterized membrane protein YeiH
MDYILNTIEILAILASAYSGIIEAKRNNFDFVGVFTVALVAALGGGTLRDVLLDRRPLYWIQNWEILIYIFILAAVGLLLLRFNRDFSSRTTLLVIDALGLGLFCASGVGLALAANVPFFPAVLIGVVTATFGGVLRDILCLQTPQLFQPTQPLYATCAFIGAWVYIAMYSVGTMRPLGLMTCIIVTFFLRILAVRFNLKLPF